MADFFNIGGALKFGQRRLSTEELQSLGTLGERAAGKVAGLLNNAIFDAAERRRVAAERAALEAQQPYHIAVGSAQRLAASQQQAALATAGQEALDAGPEQVQVEKAGQGAATASRRRRASGASSSIRI